MMWDAIEMNLSVLCGEWGRGLEAGKLGGGTLREVGAGKSGRWEFSKGGSGRTREKIRNNA